MAGTPLAQGWLELTVSTAGAQKSMTDAIVPGAKATGDKAGGLLGGGIAGGVKSALGPIAAITGAAFGTAAIIGWGKAQVDSLARIESINAQTANVIESTGGAAGVSAQHIQDLAGRLEGLTATEGEGIQEGANLLLTFKNIQNGVGEGSDIFDQATGSLVDMARAMGQEPAAAAVQLGKALNDPIAGISALSRVGITFTDDQKGLITSLTESGNVMEAQKIILNELNSQFGGSGAAYAATYAGKIDLLGHAWGGFGEQLFSTVTPALGALASGLTSLLNNVLTPFVAAVQGAISILTTGDFQSSFFEAFNIQEDSPIIDFLFDVRETFISIWGSISPLLTAFGEAFGQIFASIGPLIPQFIDLWMQISPLSIILGAIMPVLPALGAAFGQLAAALGGVLSSTLTTLGPLLTDLAVTLSGALGSALAAIMPLLPVLIDVFAQLAGTLGGALSSILTTLAPVLSSLASTLSGALGQALTALMPVVTQVVEILAGKLGETITMLVPIVGEIAGVLGTVLGSVINALLPIIVMLAEIFGTIFEAVSPVIGILVPLIGVVLELIAPLLQLVGSILTPLIDLFGALLTPILGLIGPLVGLLVPILQVAVGVLTAIIEGVVGVVTWLVELVTGTGDAGAQLGAIWDFISQVFTIAIGLIVGAVTGFIDNTIGMFTDFGNNLVTGVQIIWGNVTGFFADGINGIVQFFTDLPGNIMGALGDIGTFLLTAGQDLIQGFIDGITGMLGGVGDAVGGVMDFVGDFFPHSPAKRGPLSGSGWRAILSSGTAMGDQYAAGILGSRPGVQSAMTQLTSGVVPPARFVTPDSRQYASSSGVGVAGSRGRDINVTMNATDGMPVRTLVDATFDRVNFDANVLGVLG